VLDMGEPVRILDLARQMILLAGLRLDKDIEITFTGPRPGEKLHEELLHAGEALVETETAGIREAAPRTADLTVLARALDELATAASAGRGAETVALIEHLVPEYRREPAAAARATAAQ